jgi:hypothetical protein
MYRLKLVALLKRNDFFQLTAKVCGGRGYLESEAGEIQSGAQGSTQQVRMRLTVMAIGLATVGSVCAFQVATTFI